MDKGPQLLATHKTELMPNNASCQRWDTPMLSQATDGSGP